jgi:hypothetical protein
MSGNQRRFRAYAKAIYLYLVLSSIGLLLGGESYIAKTCPRVADESSGHIYRTNMHGVVYLTLIDRWLLYSPFGVMAAAFIFASISEGVLSSKDK